jgi:hypothetical protein
MQTSDPEDRGDRRSARLSCGRHGRRHRRGDLGLSCRRHRRDAGCQLRIPRPERSRGPAAGSRGNRRRGHLRVRPSTARAPCLKLTQYRPSGGSSSRRWSLRSGDIHRGWPGGGQDEAGRSKGSVQCAVPYVLGCGCRGERVSGRLIAAAVWARLFTSAAMGRLGWVASARAT